MEEEEPGRTTVGRTMEKYMKGERDMRKETRERNEERCTEERKNERKNNDRDHGKGQDWRAKE